MKNDTNGKLTKREQHLLNMFRSMCRHSQNAVLLLMQDGTIGSATKEADKESVEKLILA